MRKEKKSNWWKSIMCCSKKMLNNQNTEDKSEPYDYVLEKLVLQRVPLGVLKTNLSNSSSSFTELSKINSDNTRICMENEKLETPEKSKIISKIKFVEAPVEVHYKASNLQLKKNTMKSKSQIFTSSDSCEKIYSDRNITDDSSETTLRWKIIIKHNQTTENKDKNFKNFSFENISKSF
ncbi:uncharacterized protein LOC127277094 [Leptopilina boulardi]|uniref:uncharacterized protein LOC127277094 n=1 Tax=Leptopilina boulardi TaxID=63433 RepID=UPI0021F5C1E6|nr:uncharacterized protein LOC127277094 [Leptopilina boulardi]